MGITRLVKLTNPESAQPVGMEPLIVIETRQFESNRFFITSCWETKREWPTNFEVFYGCSFREQREELETHRFFLVPERVVEKRVDLGRVDSDLSLLAVDHHYDDLKASEVAGKVP